jgi:diguanylate cyclase (GGDEF)-like protein
MGQQSADRTPDTGQDDGPATGPLTARAGAAAPAAPPDLAGRLRESEDRLRVALWAAGMVGWEWDVAAGEVRVTGSLGTLADPAGALAHLLPGQLADVHPDDRAALARAERWTLAEGADYDVEFRIRAPDGAARWLAQKGRVVAADAAGRPLRVAGVVMDVTERRRLQEALAHRATHDPLTDLPNRALFLDRLGHALARARRRAEAAAVLFVDLDDFKDVNDGLGHDAGDRLLVAVAARLRAALRAEDTVARLGGDEFAVLLEGVDRGVAVAAATRVVAALRAPFALDRRAARVGASVGIALGADGGAEPAALLRAADAALYRAKAGGRAGYAVAEPEPEPDRTA